MNKEKIEELREKLKIKKAKLAKRKAFLQQKATIASEFNKEKSDISNLKKENKEARKELFNNTNIGKAAKGLTKAGKTTARIITSETSQKLLRNSTLAIGNFLGFVTKKQVKNIKKKYK